MVVPTKDRFNTFKHIVEDPIPCTDGADPQPTGATFGGLVIAPDKCVLKAAIAAPTPANVKKLEMLFAQRVNQHIKQAVSTKPKPTTL